MMASVGRLTNMIKSGSIGLLVALSFVATAWACPQRVSKNKGWPDGSSLGPFSVVYVSYLQIDSEAVPTKETRQVATIVSNTCLQDAFNGSHYLFSTFSPEGGLPRRLNEFLSVPEDAAVEFADALRREFFGPGSSPRYPRHDIRVEILGNPKLQLRVRVGRHSPATEIPAHAMDEMMDLGRTEMFNAEFCRKGYGEHRVEASGQIGGRILWVGYAPLKFSHSDLCP